MKKLKTLFWINGIISIIGSITMIIFICIDKTKDYSYIPLLIAIFTYGNTKYIEMLYKLNTGK